MDLQTRKIAFVQEFLKLESEKVISQLESVLKKENKSEFKPMSVEELNQRIDKSMEDSKRGKLLKNIELKDRIDKWT